MADPIGTSLLFFLIIGVVYLINLIHSLLKNRKTMKCKCVDGKLETGRYSAKVAKCL